MTPGNQTRLKRQRYLSAARPPRIEPMASSDDPVYLVQSCHTSPTTRTVSASTPSSATQHVRRFVDYRFHLNQIWTCHIFHFHKRFVFRMNLVMVFLFLCNAIISTQHLLYKCPPTSCTPVSSVCLVSAPRVSKYSDDSCHHIQYFVFSPCFLAPKLLRQTKPVCKGKLQQANEQLVSMNEDTSSSDRIHQMMQEMEIS